MMGERLPHGEFLSNPKRIAAQIQNRKHPDLTQRLLIIYSERKTTGQHPMETEMPGMNAVKKAEILEIGKQRISEVVADTYLLCIVKIPTQLQILCGFA